MLKYSFEHVPCEHDEEDEELHDTEAAGNVKENQRDCVPVKHTSHVRRRGTPRRIAEKNHMGKRVLKHTIQVRMRTFRVHTDLLFSYLKNRLILF